MEVQWNVLDLSGKLMKSKEYRSLLALRHRALTAEGKLRDASLDTLMPLVTLYIPLCSSNPVNTCNESFASLSIK